MALSKDRRNEAARAVLQDLMSTLAEHNVNRARDRKKKAAKKPEAKEVEREEEE